jgi:hypothetical protein
MTSLELHEHMTPEQHKRWMSMPDEVYELSKKFVEKRVAVGQSVRQAIECVDESYRENINLDDVPF